MIRFHGLFAPNSTLRRKVTRARPVPQAPAQLNLIFRQDDSEPALPSLGPVGLLRDQQVTIKVDRTPWARLLKRIFKVDLENCHRCGGRMRIKTVAQDPDTIQRLLFDHGYTLEPPVPPHPPRPPPQLTLPWPDGATG